jgi:hypothetical protein
MGGVCLVVGERGYFESDGKVAQRGMLRSNRYGAKGGWRILDGF